MQSSDDLGVDKCHKCRIGGSFDVTFLMGIAISIFGRIFSRLSLFARRTSEMQLVAESKATVKFDLLIKIHNLGRSCT